MKTVKTIEKRNGKMTKRETIREMYLRAMSSESSCQMSFSYMKRRLGFGDDATFLQFMGWMRENTFINFFVSGRSIYYCA
jgi:hypothetical protein